MYFSLTENRYELINTYPVLISPFLVDTLRQTRSEMSVSGIEELISSIKESGQQTPGSVYAFKKVEAIKYLCSMNNFWDTDYSIYDFDPVFFPDKLDYYYLFVVAGHRRRRAAITSSKSYFANIQFDKSFEEAIKWQMAENLHEQVSVIDLVVSARALWDILIKSKKITITEFSRKYVHKSPGWTSDALKFRNLPQSVQNMVRKTKTVGGINYSILVHFARLYDFSMVKKKPMKVEELEAIINYALSKSFSLSQVAEFCAIRKAEILGQQVAFSLVPEEVNKETLKRIKSENTREALLASRKLDMFHSIVPEIAQKVTPKCVSHVNGVVQKSSELEKKLPSE